MDLRALIEKMDAIEQRKLLQESEQLMEKVRIRYSDVEAIAKQYQTDDNARGKALAKLAQDNGLPGLFDPVSRELVNPDGSYSTFKGADEATVNQLKQWGLLPMGAKTSSWLGMRGQDEKTATTGNVEAQSRDAMVDRAEALMKQAITAATSTAANEGIADSLLESFGINTVLVEYITSKEHTELKDLVQKLTPFAKTDPDAADIVAQYRAYNQQRDQLIARIKELIAAIKAAGTTVAPTTTPASTTTPATGSASRPTGTTVAPTTTPASTTTPATGSASRPTNEKIDPNMKCKTCGTAYKDHFRFKPDGSIESTTVRHPTMKGDFPGMDGMDPSKFKESIEVSHAPLIENVDSVNKHTFKYLEESQTFLVDGNECHYNPENDTLFYEDANGEIVEYSMKDFGSDVGDFTRGVGHGLTFGTLDNIVAYAKSKVNGTAYGAELKKELQKTEKSWERSPWLMFAGNATGGMAFGVTGLARNAALIAADLGFQHVKKGMDAKAVVGAETGAKPQANTKPQGFQPSKTPTAQPAAATNQDGAKLAQSIGLDLSSKQAAEASLQQLMQKTGAKSQAEAIAIAVGANTQSESIDDISRLAGISEEVRLPPGSSRWIDPLMSAGERAFANTRVVRLGGQTWERVPGVADKFYNPATKEIKDAGDIYKMTQAAEKAGGTATSATTNTAANTATTAATSATTAATASTSKVMQLIRSAGGKVTEWAKNKKWLAIILGLTALGVVINGLSGDSTTSTTDTNTNTNPVQPRPTPDDSKEKEKQRQLAELNKLLDQLAGGWPTDAETAEALRLAAEVGGKPTASAESGSGARPTPASAPQSKDLASQWAGKTDADNVLRGKERANP